MEKENRLYLLNLFNGKRLWETDVYNRVKKILTDKGLRVCCPSNFTIEERIELAFNLKPGDLVISHQPQISIKKQNITTFCQPGIIQSRSSRMNFLNSIGFPTMDWVEGYRVSSLEYLFDIWNTNQLIMKSNDSFQSKGIKILNRNSILPEIKIGDLFCKIINNDPFTYKVDFFHDTILGAYVKQTPSILDNDYIKWIHGDNKDQLDFPNQNRHYFYLPDYLKQKIKILGNKLTAIGGGYSSIDLMKTKNGFKAIELNISEIATKYTWLTRPNQYSKNFSNGILNLCKDYSFIEFNERK